MNRIGIVGGIGPETIGQQGWLRALFRIDEKSKIIYVVDIFWKKSNAISTADRLRANQRIRELKQARDRGIANLRELDE